jgi:Subtilase family
MLSKRVTTVVGAVVTVVLLATADGTFAQHSAPEANTHAGPEGNKDARKSNEHKDTSDPVKQKGTAALPQREVLCERIPSAGITINGEETAGNEGKRRASGNYYSLSSVTVPQGGWKIDAVAIYTTASLPKEWLKLRRARLNVFPRKADWPAANEDPRQGREVEVSVREIRKGVYEVRAADLKLTLDPGEYWTGLTPIYAYAQGSGQHLLAGPVRDARFDDVFRKYGGGDKGEEGKWTALYPDRLDQHLSIRIEGWHIRRGQLLDSPAEKGKGAKQLHLRFATFDPLRNPPQVPKELTAPEDGNLWIVQCHETVDQQAREQLTRVGATLLRYLPDDAYIVRLAPDAALAIRRLPGVRWVGPYHPAFRLDPDVFPEPFTRVYGILPMESQAKERKGWRSVLVYLFDRDEGTKKAVAQVIRDAGGKVVFQSPRGFYLAANVPLDQLAAVARCEAVCAIERRFGAFEFQAPAKGSQGFQDPAKGDKGFITLSQIRELCGADAVKKAGGFEGLGVRVAFWDSGIREDHVDLLARPLTIIGPAYWLGANHGTQVASILCGEGRGDSRARGLLPLGGLVFATDQGDSVHEDRYGLVERFVRDHRAVVLSNSSSNWGGDEYIKHYDGYSFLLDDLVLDYDLLICEAIGNTNGSGTGSSGSWAKNAVIVGGVHSHGNLRRGDHRPIFTCGPAPDGRVKPDLVHFASGVFCANASSPRGYGTFGGTSCATPLVAGHCGLMMEMWADGAFGNLPLGRSVLERKPHAATARALMINSAYRYPIEGEKPLFPRFRQGWGMPDLTRLYESRKKLFIVDQEIALRDHQAIEHRLWVPEGEPELRVTLAWTDPLGTTVAAKSLVNDLDLIVIAPDGKRYLGNYGLLEANVSREGGAPDRINNVENVFLEKPVPGVWRVLVAAHRIAWERHCPTPSWDQDFALVVAGVERDH